MMKSKKTNEKISLKIEISPFKKKREQDPNSKRKTQGCWGPTPDDYYNQC